MPEKRHGDRSRKFFGLACGLLFGLQGCGQPIAMDILTTASAKPSLESMRRSLPPVTLIATESPDPEPKASPPSSSPADPTPALGPQDISVRHPTTVNGRLYDSSGMPIEQATVLLRALQGIAYARTTLALGGTYVFNDAPAGIPLEIRVETPGYGPVRQTVVLKSNPIGDPRSNTVDFGGPTQPQYFLGNGPEIIAASGGGPNRIFKGQNPALGLTFNKAINPDTLPGALSVRTLEDLSIAGSVILPAGAVVYSGQQLSYFWHDNQTQVQIRLPVLPGHPQKHLRYALHFDSPFEAQDQTQAHLDLAAGLGPVHLAGQRQLMLPFSLQTDEIQPKLLRVTRNRNTLVLQLSKTIASHLGASKQRVYAPSLETLTTYRLSIDTNQNGSFSKVIFPVQVSPEDTELTLLFTDLSPYAGYSARLLILPDEIVDLSGQPLERPKTAELQL